MTSAVQIPKDSQIDPMSIQGFKYITDEDGKEWVGLSGVIKYFIMPHLICLNVASIRTQKLTPIIGEHSFRQMTPIGAKSSYWYISDLGLAQLVVRRDNLPAKRLLPQASRDGLGRLSDWAATLLNEGTERVSNGPRI